MTHIRQELTLRGVGRVCRGCHFVGPLVCRDQLGIHLLQFLGGFRFSVQSPQCLAVSRFQLFYGIVQFLCSVAHRFFQQIILQAQCFAGVGGG